MIVLKGLTKKYYLLKDIIENYNVIINGKNFYEWPIDSDIKWYEEITRRMLIRLWIRQKLL